MPVIANVIVSNQKSPAFDTKKKSAPSKKKSLSTIAINDGNGQEIETGKL
jgi:hypothetical protein